MASVQEQKGLQAKVLKVGNMPVHNQNFSDAKKTEVCSYASIR